MTQLPRGLVATFVVACLVTIALGAVLALPASQLTPLRTGVLDLDEATPSTR